MSDSTEQPSKDGIKILVARAAGSDLFSIGEIVNKILSTIRNPATSAGELKKLIEVDPPLCAKVLSRANSAYYGFKREISSIQDAIVFIGYNAINELCLSMKVGTLFEKERNLSFYSRRNLWSHSLAVATCSKLLYRRELGLRGDNIYSASLLHDLGVIVEEQYSFVEFKEIVKGCEGGQRSFLELEHEILGFGHPEVAAALAAQWSLPEWMGASMRLHHEPELSVGLGGEIAMASRAIFVSDIAARLAGFGWEAPPSERDMQRWNAALGELNVSPKAMEIIIQDAKAEMQRLKEAGDMYL